MSTQPDALRLADALEAQADCTCHAAHYYECACDAIWPEQWIGSAAAKLRRLHAQRKPLTDEEIDRITRDRWGTQLLGVMVQAHREYARAIERAHGIGGQHE